MTRNPFAVLGLPAWPDLDDETVRAAWRAIAAETHPDREDGGDLARYTQACAAFAELNSPWGRSEAYADLAGQARSEGHDDCPGLFYLCLSDEERPPPVPVMVELGRSLWGRWRVWWPRSRPESAAATRSACSCAPPSSPGYAWPC